MPTPFAVLRAFLTPSAVVAVEEAYTEAMLRELEQIASDIPHQDLAFQWDVAPEMIEWDARGNAGGMLGPDRREGILTRLTRLSDAVPPDIRHRYHFCYGDFDASQVEKPATPAAMIDLYAALAERVARPIDWVHMPVPAHAGREFFEAFRNLRLRLETQLYFGLIYGADNGEGAKQRIAMAADVVSDFGIATRWGIARGRSVDAVRELLELHATLA